MVGKSMRCPNLDCRQVFTVKPQPKEIEPPPPDPVPEPAAPLPLPPEPSAAAGKAKKPTKPGPAVVDAEIVEAAIVAPPKVKEVVWSEGTDVPPGKGKGKKPVRPEVIDDGDDEPIR